jgi:sigma-54 specific flagellar transcriptional regulator A
VLIDHLLERQSQTGGRIRLDAKALERLAEHSWPGNVRELSNLLERLAILFPAQAISAADLPERYRGNGPLERPVEEPRPFIARTPALPATVRREAEVLEEDDEVVTLTEPQAFEMLDAHLPRGGIDLKDHLSAIEIGLIRKALEEADGTVAEAARLLRIRRTTLVEKLRKYRLTA